MPSYDLEELDAIVGIEIHVSEIRARFKLSQNRTVADRLRVVEALRARRSEHGAGIASMMIRGLSATGDNAR